MLLATVGWLLWTRFLVLLDHLPPPPILCLGLGAGFLEAFLTQVCWWFLVGDFCSALSGICGKGKPGNSPPRSSSCSEAPGQWSSSLYLSDASLPLLCDVHRGWTRKSPLWLSELSVHSLLFAQGG